MKDIRNIVRKEIKKIWPRAQKDIDRLGKDTAKLMKKTEKNLIDLYAQAKKTTQETILKAQREKLYYELGRSVASLLTSDQLKNKAILRLDTEIRQINRKLRAKK